MCLEMILVKIWNSLTPFCTVIKQHFFFFFLHSQEKSNIPTTPTVTNNQFLICKPRSSANYQNYCENHRRTKSGRYFENKTICWNLASIKKIQRNESAKFSIFLSLSLSILYTGKAIFISLTTFHCRYPSPIHSEMIVYVQCPCSLKGVSSLESIRKFCAEERTALTCHSLVTCIKKIHFSPLSGIFPWRLKRNQGIGSKIGCVLEAAPGLSLEWSQSAGASERSFPAILDKRQFGAFTFSPHLVMVEAIKKKRERCNIYLGICLI